MSSTAIAPRRVPLAEALMQVAAIADQIERNDGAADDEVLQLWTGALADVGKAVDRRIGVLDGLASAKTYIKLNIDRLQRALSGIENAETRLKENTLTWMVTMDVPKLEGSWGSVRIQKNGGKQSIGWLVTWRDDIKRVLSPSDLSKFPTEYHEHFEGVRLSERFDEDLRSGRVVATAGAQLIERGQHVRIG